MDLSYGAENEAYRAEVKVFLDLHWNQLDTADQRGGVKIFRRKATDAGFLNRSIPRAYAGSEQPVDVIKAQIIREEFAKARAPMEVSGNGMSMLVPTLLDKGADWQKEQFIRPTVEGEIGWAQGYSEPGSGSDLASIRTSAVLEDGHWIINGQKLWTSLADRSHYMFALVRTEPDAPKHAGISYLLLDLRQPGVTIRPLRQMTGEAEFSEVFFDNARTPEDWIVGARGEGWQVSKTTLKHERASMGGAERAEALFAKIVELARDTGRLGDQDIRQALATLEGNVLALKYSGYRLFSSSAAGHDAGLIGLLSKLQSTDLLQDVAQLAQELIGDAALLQPALAGKGAKRGNEKWLDQIMGSLGMAIAGGTSNIQRNLIAERGLGLPRDSDLSKGEA
jgi:alkylation response protein AidB-like acyl-CoA dehydrogenase